MLAATVLLGLLGGTALAADFVFTIPVELEKIPERAGVLVYCNVFNADGQGIGGGNQGVQVNRNTGQFKGNVTVSVDVQAQQNPFSARTYRCHLTMTIPGSTPKWGEPSPTSEVEEFRPKPGTEFIGEVRGDLPAVISPKALDPRLRRVPGAR
jgi:hypothetical protein